MSAQPNTQNFESSPYRQIYMDLETPLATLGVFAEMLEALIGHESGNLIKKEACFLHVSNEIRKQIQEMEKIWHQKN